MSGRSWVAAEFRIQESGQGVKIHKEVVSMTEIKEV